MTVTIYTRDLFSYGGLPDIELQTPDGGGDVTLQNGIWHRNTTFLGTNKLTTPVAGGYIQGDGDVSSAYALDLLTTLPDDYTTRARGQFTTIGGSGVSWFSVWANLDRFSQSGYQLSLEETHFYPRVALYKYFVDAFGDEFEVLESSREPLWRLNVLNTDRILELIREKVPHTDLYAGPFPETYAVKLTARLDGDTIFSYIDDFPLTGGSPGVDAINTAPATRTCRVSLFEVDDDLVKHLPGGGTGVALVPYAQDEFTGADSADIHGRVPDGAGIPCLAQGEWAETVPTHGSIPQVLYLEDELVRYSGLPDGYESLYAVKDIPGLAPQQSIEALWRVNLYPVEPPPGASNHCEILVGARLSLDGQSAYVYIVSVNPFGVTQRRQHELWKIAGGSWDELGHWMEFYNVPLDEQQVSRVCVYPVDGGGEAVACFFNGELKLGFTDFTSPHTTGDPGFGMLDDHLGTGLFGDRWRVLSTIAGAPCGGGGNGGGSAGTFLWQMKNKSWRKIYVPSADRQDVKIKKNMAQRPLTAMKIKKNLLFRPLVGAVDNGDWNDDPGNAYPPDLGCVDLINFLPPTDIVPLTSRVLGMSALPDELLGPLFNGTQRATGNWTPGEFSSLTSRASFLRGAQGGYRQYQLGGTVWDKDTFVSVTIARLTPILSGLVAGQPDPFQGYSIIDDFESHVLWPPSGVPLAELADAIVEIRAALPGLVLGVRGFPSQFPTDPGFDFYIAQFVNHTSLSAFDFGVREYTLALARNAYVYLDLNFIGGGNHSSGIRHFDGTIKGSSANNYEVSPTELYDCLTGMWAGAASVDPTLAKMVGSLGYTYNSDFLGRPGMIDSFAAARNVLAGYPPL